MQPASTRHLLPDRRSSGQRRGTGRQVRGLPVQSLPCTEAELDERGERRRMSGAAWSEREGCFVSLMSAFAMSRRFLRLREGCLETPSSRGFFSGRTNYM